MRQKMLVVAIALVAFAPGSTLVAELCTIDAVPAATLLLPHFQVDIGDSDGDGVPDCRSGSAVDTLFSLNNASAAPALAHVTLWTDWSLPTIDFDVFLTGYDVQTVSLCSVFNGELPVTADEQNDPADEISPHAGMYSDNPIWDGSFPNCAGVFPFPSPALNSSLLDRLQNGHAGYDVDPPVGACMGEGLNGAGKCVGGVCPAGTIARGYITIDNVNQCSTVFPAEPNYFQVGGTGIANNINQLWGDYFQLDGINAFAQGDNLVHIETPGPGAGGAAPGFGAGDYTFYGRYVDGLATDQREPLGTTWAARYLNGGAFTGGTSYKVWRDSKFNSAAGINQGYACGISATPFIGPAWTPLDETQVVCFNEAEDAVQTCATRGGGVISPPTLPTDEQCFPLETQSVQVGVFPLVTPFDFGWCYLNLNFTLGDTSGFPIPGTTDGIFGDIAQSYVSVTHDALGLFSVGLPAVELANACQTAGPGGNPANQIITGDLGEP